MAVHDREAESLVRAVIHDNYVGEVTITQSLVCAAWDRLKQGCPIGQNERSRVVIV